MIDLSIIIVSWNVKELLRRCLQTIEERGGGLVIETIVVDGGSKDGSAAMVAAEFPEVVLIARPDNVGFPKGNNLGLAIANGRYLLLLNPDTEIVGDALVRMVDYLEKHPEVGIVGPQLRYPDGTIQSSRRRFPTVATAFFESSWLTPYAPAAVLANYYVQDLADDEEGEVDWVVGACLLSRKEIYEQVGELDEGYFMYSEELDWCRRIRAEGWKGVYLPAAVVIHYEGQSSGQVVTKRHIYFQRAKLRYFLKYHGLFITVCLRVFLLSSYALQLCVEGIKWVIGHKRPLRAERMSAYLAILRTGLPPAG